jgi:hypothetical protein
MEAVLAAIMEAVLAAASAAVSIMAWRSRDETGVLEIDSDARG